MKNLLSKLLANRIVLGLLVVTLVQTGVLAGMVVDRVRLIESGREITLPIVPVDPRDLFRGEYVRLGYDVGRVPATTLEGPLPGRGDAFYVTMERGTDGSWKPIRLSLAKPTERSPDRIVLKGRPMFGRLYENQNTPDAAHMVRYGIESYFVPQGQGLRLEKLARDRKLAARIAVDGDGNAAIKGLLIDGVVQYEEPLF